MSEIDLWIAIVGSADPERLQELSLKNPADALRAAEYIGAELANRGCRIVIYSFRSEFIETRAAQGYLASGKAKPNSIRLVYPQDSGEPELGDCEKFREAFDFVPDPRSAWEISFYESLHHADGVVLVGGGRSTMVAGVLSILDRRPVVALAGFGGAANDVWRYLPTAMVTPDERSLMAQPKWSEQSAAQCVNSLLRQRDQLIHEAAERQREQEKREASDRQRLHRLASQSWIAAIVLVLAIAVAAYVWSSPPPYGGVIALLFLSPLVTGVSGALFRRSFDAIRGQPESRGPASAVAALGLAAGAITGLVFVVTQLTAFPESIEGAQRAAVLKAQIEHASKILPTAMVTGFVAGLTLDAVFTKLIHKGNEPEKNTE